MIQDQGFSEVFDEYLCLKDPDLNYLDMNLKMMNILNISDNTVLGSNDFDWFPNDHSELYREVDRMVLSGESVNTIDFVKLPMIGNNLLAYSQKRPKINDKGKVTAVCVRSRFITPEFVLENVNLMSQIYVNKLFKKKIIQKNYHYQNFYFTPREAQVISFLLKGYTDKGVARMLDISDKTVSWHKSNIKNKTGVYNSQQLLQTAFEYGFIELMFMDLE